MRKVSSPASVPTTSRVIQVVDLAGDRGGRADLAAHHDEVLGDRGGPGEVAQHVAGGLLGVFGALARRQYVLGAPEVGAHLLQVELADVARDGRLRDLAAQAAQGVDQLPLRGDLALHDHGLDQSVTFRLAHGLALVPGYGCRHLPHLSAPGPLRPGGPR